MQPLIVGIDPGTTSAFAVLSFDGSLLESKSRRNYSLPKLILDSYDKGTPILVGTDKKEIPSFIKEYSQKTGAKIITPRYDLKKGEKKTRVKKYGMLKNTANVHEVDALASAIYAYDQYRPLIKKIDLFVDRNEKPELRDRIIRMLLDEDGLSIKKAAEILEHKPDVRTVEKEQIEQRITRKILSLEQRQILYLINQNIKLKQQNNELQKRLDKPETSRVDDLAKRLLTQKEKKIWFFEKKIKALNFQINALQEKLRITHRAVNARNDSYTLVRIPKLGAEEIGKLSPGGIPYVENISTFSPSSLEALQGLTKIIVYRNGSNRILEKHFCLVPSHKLSMTETSTYALVRRSELDRVKMDYQPKNSDILENIISEYKRERMK